VAPDYSQTIVARSARDYVWIMARTPTLPDEDYARLVSFVGELGYDIAKLERVPQQW
jgi:apolipoprotein D and lipocalin family protein